MTKYITFLRGINVGGRIIKMAELKECFEALGFTSVATILQSGNIVFETAIKQSDLKDLIEDNLVKKFHYPIRVQVFSLDKLKEIVASSPFTANESHHNYVIFFENNLDKQLFGEATGLNHNIEQVESGDGVIYWRVPIGLTLKSNFAKYLTKTAYKNFNTNRNINTLRKIIHR